MFLSKIIALITHKKLSNLWFFSLSFIIIFLLIFPYFPSNDITQLLEYVIYLSPRWILLLLFIPIFLFCRKLTKTRYFLLLLYVVFSINFQDINFNTPTNTQSESAIKLVSLNMGGGTDARYLKILLKLENPDIFLFQEAQVAIISNVFPQPWKFQCDAGLCIASRYKFNKLGHFSRRQFESWGNFAVYYELDINGKTLPLMNVHLETPRHILSNLLDLSVNWANVTKFIKNKSFESSLISNWASTQPYFVMSGDFNMTTNESLYRDYFTSFQNAIDTVGVGFNYTKYTSWHGVRIDHVLTSDHITVERADVMPSVGGDHRAVVTTIVLP